MSASEVVACFIGVFLGLGQPLCPLLPWARPLSEAIRTERLMSDRTITRRLQGTDDAALASDDGPILSTVAELFEALKRSITEGT
jgi:hypothetical protein